MDVAVGLRDHATAMIDVSDGVLADLGHLCDASDVHACVNIDALPLSSHFTRFVQSSPARAMYTDARDAVMRCALSGGEDYELLFTARPARGTRLALDRLASTCGVPITRIGEILTFGKGIEAVRVKDDLGAYIPVTTHGYTHF